MCDSYSIRVSYSGIKTVTVRLAINPYYLLLPSGFLEHVTKTRTIADWVHLARHQTPNHPMTRGIGFVHGRSKREGFQALRRKTMRTQNDAG